MRKKIEFNHAWEIAKWMEENEGKPLFLYEGTSLNRIEKNADKGFIYADKNSSNWAINDSWSLRTFYIEEDWTDTLDQGKVFCWVSYECEGDRNLVRPICELDGIYFDDNKISWKHATPLTEEEAKQYIAELRT